MSEFEIAGVLAQATLATGAAPIVNLIATDERISAIATRCPRPGRSNATPCGAAAGDGLVASITRLVHFGPLPAELRRKMLACATIDATLIGSTRPGVRLVDVFGAATAAYAAAGFPDEWRHHHQGGPASYAPRDFLATPTSAQIVQADQAYAWNPSIAGVKSEDTILVGAAANEVLTAIDGWPMVDIEAVGQTIARPVILEIG